MTFIKVNTFERSPEYVEKLQYEKAKFALEHIDKFKDPLLKEKWSVRLTTIIENFERKNEG